MDLENRKELDELLATFDAADIRIILSVARRIASWHVRPWDDPSVEKEAARLHFWRMFGREESREESDEP